MGVRFMPPAFDRISRNRRGVTGEWNLRSRRGLRLEHPKWGWGFCG
jgi:hypothetical protein